jgi:ankyrin repeat protein
LHQALRRDNALENIEAMLDYGGDPTLENRGDGRSAVAIAAQRGRGNVLELIERRGMPIRVSGIDRLLAACARNDGAGERSVLSGDAELVSQLLDEGGKFLAQFAGVGNIDGVRHLLDLGVNVGALFREGDGYYGIAKDSTALHVAAWRARHATVKLLIERGDPIEARDGEGRTPLTLAVRACVDSFWTERRSPESVEALLGAGASLDGVDFPSGYAEVDELLRRH